VLDRGPEVLRDVALATNFGGTVYYNWLFGFRLAITLVV